MPDATWQEVEKEGHLLWCLIRRLSGEEKREAACWIVEEVVVAAGDDVVEWLGLLELVKVRLLEHLHQEQEDEG